jgi:hypothetical protein
MIPKLMVKPMAISEYELPRMIPLMSCWKNRKFFLSCHFGLA